MRPAVGPLILALLMTTAPASSAPALETSATAPETVASSFVDALTADQIEAFEKIATAEAVASPDWQLLRNRVEKFQCVTVASHELRVESMTGDRMLLLVQVHGTARNRGAVSVESPLHDRFEIEAQLVGNEWKLKSAVLYERRIAQEIGKQRPVTTTSILSHARDGDLATILIELADVLIGEPSTETRRASYDALMSLAWSISSSIAVQCMRDYATAEVAVKSDEAIARTREVLRLATELGDAGMISASHHALGIAYWIIDNNFTRAVDEMRQAADLIERVPDARGPMKSRYMASYLLAIQGDLRSSLVETELLSAAAERFDWTEGRCITAFRLLNLHWMFGNEEVARAYAQEAYRMALRMNDQGFIAMALHNLTTGTPSGEVPDTEEIPAKLVAARKALRWVREIGHEIPIRHGIGELLIAQGNVAEAEAELTQALSMAHTFGDKENASFILITLAKLRLSQKRNEEGLQFATEADELALAARAVRPTLEANDARSKSILGEALRAVGRRDEAIEAFRRAVEIVELGRDSVSDDPASLSLYFDSKAAPYQQLVSMLVEQGQLEEALVVAEQLKGRTLGDVLDGARIDRSPTMTAEEKAQELALNESISALNRQLLENPALSNELRGQLAEKRTQLRRFLADVYMRRPTLRTARPEAFESIAHNAPSLLRDDASAVLIYSVHDSETFAFLLRKRGDEVKLAVRRIAAGRRDLETRVLALVHSIETRDLQYRRKARQIDQLLVEPLDRELDGVQRLCIIPDRALWRLPFEVLVASDGKHLVERRSMMYAPSLALLRVAHELPKRSSTSMSILAVGDPTLRGATRSAVRTLRDFQLTQLPEARVEANEIARFYGSSARVLVGDSATETAVKQSAGKVTILHLATHGLIDDHAQLYSALVLTPSVGDDGLLEAREIASLPLQADLVVLSACDTASGQVVSGEGLIGMAWAVMAAGCPRMIGTQWRVDSAASARLMVAFHRRLSRSNSMAAVSDHLRGAQLELLHSAEYSHPYYWAGFVLIGRND